MRCKGWGRAGIHEFGSGRWDVELGGAWVSAQEPAGATEMDALRKQVVGSMRLTGTLAVGPGGAVTGYVIDHSEKVPPEVLRHVARYVPRWRVVKRRRR